MFITLEEAKLYLKVESEEDNTLITSCISAAKELCEDILRFPISEFSEVPETVNQAVLYAVGNMYEQRETLDMKEILDVMTRLLFGYRKEEW